MYMWHTANCASTRTASRAGIADPNCTAWVVDPHHLSWINYMELDTATALL